MKEIIEKVATEGAWVKSAVMNCWMLQDERGDWVNA